MVLIVTYDLHNPGRDYAAVAKVLEGARSWAHPQGSVWFLDTSDPPSVWRDRLKQAGDAGDEYFVARMHQNWASFNLGDRMNAWLSNTARTW